MNCVCATGIDSILQSSALPSVDRMCREITPSRVHVMIAVGSRKALSASEMSAFEHIRQGKDVSQCDNWTISNFRRKTHIFTQASPFSGLLHGHPLISTQTDHQVSICGACSNGPGGRNREAEHEGGRQRYRGRLKLRQGGWKMAWCDCACRRAVKSHLLNVRLESTVPCLESKWNRVES